MTARAFVQIEPTPWPGGHGEALAVVALAPDAVAERCGLRFFEGSDNLGAYRAAAVRLPSGRRVGLLRHQGSPAPGSELHADAKDDFLEAIREFLEAFELTSDDLSWVREEVPIDHLRAAEQAGD